jgi:hypothetical protein
MLVFLKKACIIAPMDSTTLHPEVLQETQMLEVISGYATPADWMMAAQGLAIFAAVCFVTAWITGEW